MNRHLVARSFALVMAVVFMASQVAARPRDRDDDEPRGAAPAALELPVAGTTSTGGTFRGTFSVERFAARASQVVAVGIITGTVLGATGTPVGTLLRSPVEIPVTPSQRVAARVPPSGAPRPAGEAEPAGLPPGVILAQQACGVLHLELGAITLNVLGLVVTTSPVVLDIAGEAGGTNVLGALVCQILAVLTNIANLVGLLNQLLGVLGGLTGGLAT
jgi:hypothetical protein